MSEFSECKDLPIEVNEVADALIKHGIQDSIIFSREDTDPGKIRGIFYQYTTSPGVYCQPDFVTLIVYSSNVDLAWQRLICCKELIHVCDARIEKTDTQQEVSDLLEKILGPLSTEDYGLADMMAAVDKIALYQALAILFPAAARDSAREQLSNQKTIEDIVKWVALPKQFVELVVSDDWPDIQNSLFSFRNENNT